MGLIVILATKYIPDNNLQMKEIIMIGATSSISFAILDMISPAVSIHTQTITPNQEVKSELVNQEKLSGKVLVEAFGNSN